MTAAKTRDIDILRGPIGRGLFRLAVPIALTQMLKLKDKNFKTSPAIKWNFTKFLIGRDGEILARFEPMTNMNKVKAAVEAALK